VRLGVGPLSVSSRGRVGVRVGPVSVSGGGFRRRRSGGGGAGWGVLMGMVLVVGVVGAAIEYWYVTLPVLCLLGWLVVVLRRNATKCAAEGRRVEQEAYRAWLAGPPPTLLVPGRFTDAWFARNVRDLHPGQIPTLIHELHSRGWTDDKIAVRVHPYIRENPHVS
jgi:hypothetical protein